MRARKRFGQNFLTDQHVIQQIITAVSARPDQSLLEIGPGQGALTSHLHASGCRLKVIEIDRDLAAALKSRGFDVIVGDVLRQDLTSVTSEPTRVVGNLPYNISTPLLFRLFGLDNIVDMHFMLQKEVVDRLSASPGNRNYGRLSVMAQFHCEPEKLFEVDPVAFTPAPKVTSAVVKMVPRLDNPVVMHTILEKVVTTAFTQRRKTIRNALSSIIDENTLCSLDIDPRRRPDTLSLDDYVRCANAIGVN